MDEVDDGMDDGRGGVMDDGEGRGRGWTWDGHGMDTVMG